MFLARIWMALYGMSYCSHDGFLVMDGAWRMANGQRPHIDFNSMIGPAAYLPTVIGLRLTSNIVKGFAVGQALVGLVVGVWAYLAGQKLYQVPRVLYALCVAAIAISPGQLGLSPFALTPGVTYNRYAYSLLGILLLDVLGTEPGKEFRGGLSSGAVLGILAFMKITSFGVAVFFVVALMPLRVSIRSRWLGMAIGFVSLALPFAAYLHFDMAAMIRDLALTAAAKHVQLVELYMYDSIAFEAGTGLLLTLIASLFLFQSSAHGLAKRVLLAGLVLVLANLVLIFTNWQQSELPLLGLFFLVLNQFVVPRRPHLTVPASGTPTVMIAAATLLAGITVGSTLTSLASGIWLKTHSAKAAPPFIAPALRDFVPVRSEIGYTDFVNDGLALLQHRKAGERVMSLDFTNPFSCGLAIPPAPGGSTNLQYRGSFDAKHMVSASKLFGKADLVMVPKTFSDPSLQDSIPALYGPYLKSHFRLVAESSEWKLYRIAGAS
jgi:hypothetical protein